MRYSSAFNAAGEALRGIAEAAGDDGEEWATDGSSSGSDDARVEWDAREGWLRLVHTVLTEEHLLELYIAAAETLSPVITGQMSSTAGVWN